MADKRIKFCYISKKTRTFLEKCLHCMLVDVVRSTYAKLAHLVHVPKYFLGVSGSEDRGGGDNSIQFINIGRVGDKSFKEWRRKIGGWKGG